MNASLHNRKLITVYVVRLPTVYKKRVMFFCRDCKKLGHQSFMIVTVIITELLITLKFDWETITKPLPPHVLMFWTVGASGK